MAYNIFNEVKERVSFESIARDHGIEFNRNKKALCPYHSEKTPSFHNFGTHGYCFGCGRVADVIDIEACYTGLSLFHAALSIAKRYRITLPEFSEQDREKFDKQTEAFRLLEKLAVYANKKIKKHPEVLEFLKGKGLGIEDIDHYLIGWVENENPVTKNLKGESEVKLAEEIGLINKHGDHFKSRIIIPIWSHGKIVYLTGRAYPDNLINEYNPKYLHLKNSEFVYKQIAFSESLRKEKCLITEGITESIVFLGIGIPACSLLGTNPGKHETESLLKAKASLYFAFDPNKEGREASYKLSRKFQSHVISLGFDRDHDEILAELGKDEFKKVVEKGIAEADYYMNVIIEREDKIEVLKEILKLEFESDKEVWVKELAKKHKVSEKSLQKDMKKLEKEVANETQVSGIENKGNNQYIAVFDGLVDLVDHNGQVAFLVKENDKLEIKKFVFIDGEILYPPQRKQLPNKLLLPRAEKVIKHYIEDSDSKLYDDIIVYHKGISELPTDEYYDFLTIWDFHSYLLEKFQYSPYIWIFAIPERGKSRTGKGNIYIAYRGIHVESLRDAYLIRVANDLKATVFFDVMDLWKKAEKAGSEDILLQRFEKGTVVPRVLYPEKGAHQDTKYFDIFGATIISTNEPVHSILETRSVLISMPESSNDYELNVTPELALPYKERLVAFRARHLDKELPEIKKPIKGRLGDILKPLFQIVFLVKPEKEKAFRELISQLDRERKMQKSESLEAKLLSIIVTFENEIEDGIIHVKKITNKYNESVKKKFQISSYRVGWRLKAMSFNKGKNKKGAFIKWDDNLIDSLSEKYGLNTNSDDELFTLATSAEKRHQRHQRHFANNDNRLGGDVSGDDVLTSLETSPKRHPVSTYKQKKNDVGDVGDVNSKVVDANLSLDLEKIKNNNYLNNIKVEKIKDTVFKVEGKDENGKPIINIITPVCSEFEEIKKLYQEQNNF